MVIAHDWLSAPSATPRPPNWRFQQGAADAETGRFRLPGDTDFLVDRFTECLQTLHAAANEFERDALLRLPHCEDFRVSLDIFGDRDVACRLESLALIGHSDSSIAKALTLDEAAVALYLKLFFDVRERNRDVYYVVSAAIRPEATLGAPETARRRVAMKATAYFCGPKALQDFFFFDERNTVDSWQHPATVVRRMAAAYGIERFADLIMGSVDAPNSKGFAASVEELCEFLGAQFSAGYPTNARDYAAQNMKPFMG